MPLYDFKCLVCAKVTERITKPTVFMTECSCGCWSERQLSAPASIRMADMATLTKKRQRIKEPIWRDQATGKVTSMY